MMNRPAGQQIKAPESNLRGLFVAGKLAADETRVIRGPGFET